MAHLPAGHHLAILMKARANLDVQGCEACHRKTFDQRRVGADGQEPETVEEKVKWI